MSLTIDMLADLTNATLANLDPPKFQDLTQDLVSYPLFDMLVRGDRIKTDAAGAGDRISRRINTGYAETARFVGLDDKDAPQVDDNLQVANWEWVHADNSWTINDLEPILQSGSSGGLKTKLTDIVTLRRHQAMVANAELMEPALWGSPTDPKAPYGVKSYVVAATTTTETPTLGGGNPSTHASGVGLNSTNHPKWKNWHATYNQVSNGDLIEKMSFTMYKSGFQPAPRTTPNDHNPPLDMCQCFTGVENMVDIERLLMGQNDNLGHDAAPTYGKAILFRKKLIHVPMLDAEHDSARPLYMLNLGSFEFCKVKGRFMRESKARPHPFQHNWLVTYYDTTFQFICLDRRRQAVFTLDS